MPIVNTYALMLCRMRTIAPLLRRLYYDRPSSGTKRAPLVRVTSKRVGIASKQRSNSLLDFKETEYNPERRYEPFPFAVTESNKVEILRRVVSPLIDMPYSEQLEKKESLCRNVLREVARELYKIGTPVRMDIRRLPCNVNPIIGSPELFKYRNKDELSIWRGHDGETPTVGFMAFSIRKHGDSVSIEPTGSDTMKDESIKMADILQEFVRNKAELPVCYALSGGGWRRFIIKTNLDGEIMLVGVLSPRTYMVKQIISEKENFRDFIVSRAAEEKLALKSLMFQPCPNSRCLHRDIPYELLYGESTLSEKINGYSFRVSPETYLTPNVKATELMYKEVIKIMDDCFPAYSAGSKVKPLIIDLTCNAGALSIHLADRAEKVIGIDISEQAIADAMFNAKSNNKQNCEFICSPAEIVLERILEKNARFKSETLVVCNPSRAGLHRNIITALRQCKEVNKIIYISSKVTSPHTIDNLIELCRKEAGFSLPPFAPVVATPVDVYPHLEACELIVALERLPQ